MVKFDAGRPALLAMAFIAFLPRLPVVNIIDLMAVVTPHPKLFLFWNSLVAIFTLELCMAIDQLKFGVFIMIKMNFFPYG